MSGRMDNIIHQAYRVSDVFEGYNLILREESNENKSGALDKIRLNIKCSCVINFKNNRPKPRRSPPAGRPPRHSRVLLAGIQCSANCCLLYSALALDSRLRENDGGWVWFLKLIILCHLAHTE